MQRSQGFSMIEVLISIVILSLGLLGSAGLVGTSLKGGSESYYRSQATVLADDIIDRMRASITAARAGDYNIDLGTDISATCASSTVNTMPRFDCEDWKASLAQSLPDGDGKVTVVDGVATIVVQWNNDEQSFSTQSLL